jgi:7,8-didemethyl-8-hydroxy-5-deazariboflavin synthase
MLEEEKILKLKNLSLRKLRDLSDDIQNQKPLTERKIITFSKNFTLSISNYCQNQCGYCFYNHRVLKSDKKANNVLIESEEINNLIEQGLKYHCKEALLMSGENPAKFEIVRNRLKERNFNGYIDFIKKISSTLLESNLLPHTNIGLLSFNELNELKPYNASMGLMLESTSLKLLEEGGAHQFSLSKASSIRLNHIRNAGKLKIPFTTGLLIGIGESFEDRIKDLLIINNIYEEYGHIQEVILQNFTCKEGIPYKPKKPSSVKELLQITLIANIIFNNEIPIQVPPNLIRGYEKEFLEAGIDDFGGISPFSKDFINPEHPWPQIEELSKICQRYGFHLKERLPVYDKYIEKRGFISENIKKRIHDII